MALTKSKLYLIDKAQKKKTPKEFKNINWAWGEEESLLDVIDKMFKIHGHDQIDEDKKVYSDRGELLLYECTMKISKPDVISLTGDKVIAGKQDKIPVEIYYNPSVAYNTCVCCSCVGEEHKNELRNMMLSNLVNLRFGVSDKIAEEAFKNKKALKVIAGDFVWAKSVAASAADKDSIEAKTWTCGLPIRVEVKA